MFSYADQDCDGKINWTEFQTMINPPKPPEPPKPTKADLAVALAVKINTEKPHHLGECYKGFANVRELGALSKTIQSG